MKFSTLGILSAILIFMPASLCQNPGETLYSLSTQGTCVALVHEWATQNLQKWKRSHKRLSSEPNEYKDLASAFLDGTLLCEFASIVLHDDRDESVLDICSQPDSEIKKNFFAHEFSIRPYDGSMDTFTETLETIYSMLKDPADHGDKQWVIKYITTDKAIFEFMRGEQKYISDLIAASSQYEGVYKDKIDAVISLHLRGLLPLEFSPGDNNMLINHWESFSSSRLVHEAYGKWATSGKLGDLGNRLLQRVMYYPIILQKIAEETKEAGKFRQVIQSLTRTVGLLNEMKGQYDKFARIDNGHLLSITDPIDRRVIMWSQISPKPGDTPVSSPSSVGSMGGSYFSRMPRQFIIMTPLSIIIARGEEEACTILDTIAVSDVESTTFQAKKLTIQLTNGDAYVFRFVSMTEIVRWAEILRKVR